MGKWQYTYVTYSASVTVEYRDTLTETVGSGSTRIVRVVTELLWSTGIL